jgi:leukotriene-A4 hydrolase
LVTNASWSHFWLNEGFTVYIERMILGKVVGSEQYRHFEILCGYNVLKKTVAELHNQPEFTKLIPNLNGINPDDAFSRIPYEKGSLLLFYLETLVGGTDPMRQWLQSYFTTFRGQSIDSGEMAVHFLNHFPNVPKIDWDTWLYGTGLPPFDPTTVLDKTLSNNCTLLAQTWIHYQGQGASAGDLKDFKSKQVMFFLDELINHSTHGLPHETLSHMASLYQFSESPNVEIKFRWLQLCLKSRYTEVLPQVGDFLSKHGRGLYVKPLYKLLDDVDHHKAVEIYHANRSYYHSVIRNMFDQNLEYNKTC